MSVGLGNSLDVSPMHGAKWRTQFGVACFLIMLKALRMKVPTLLESHDPMGRFKRVLKFGGVGFGLIGFLASLKALADLLS